MFKPVFGDNIMLGLSFDNIGPDKWQSYITKDISSIQIFTKTLTATKKSSTLQNICIYPFSHTQ